MKTISNNSDWHKLTFHANGTVDPKGLAKVLAMFYEALEQEQKKREELERKVEFIMENVEPVEKHKDRFGDISMFQDLTVGDRYKDNLKTD
jgi:hypothetical protein